MTLSHRLHADMVDDIATQMTVPCKSLAMSFTAFPCTSTCRALGLPGTSFTMGDIQIPLPWKQRVHVYNT